MYRQPKGQIESFEKFLKEMFSQVKNSHKHSHVAIIFKTIILKCDVSSLKFSSKNKVFYIYKKSFNKQSIINFKIKLFDIDWQETETLHNPCSVYAYFLEQFSTLYDYIFYIIFFFPLMALKYLLNGSSVSITDFLKTEMKKMKPSIKIVKIYFKLLKKF